MTKIGDGIGARLTAEGNDDPEEHVCGLLAAALCAGTRARLRDCGGLRVRASTVPPQGRAAMTGLLR